MIMMKFKRTVDDAKCRTWMQRMSQWRRHDGTHPCRRGRRRKNRSPLATENQKMLHWLVTYTEHFSRCYWYGFALPVPCSRSRIAIITQTRCRAWPVPVLQETICARLPPPYTMLRSPQPPAAALPPLPHKPRGCTRVPTTVAVAGHLLQ